MLSINMPTLSDPPENKFGKMRSFLGEGSEEFHDTEWMIWHCPDHGGLEVIIDFAIGLS